MNEPYTEFVLSDPDVAVTSTPALPIQYKVGLFNEKQAEIFFSLNLDWYKFKIFAIDEDKMKINLIVDLQQAYNFFREQK